MKHRHLHGIWSVGNADKDEQLPSPEDQMVIGGQVLIDAQRRIVAANF